MFSSFISMPAFPLRSVTGAAALRGLDFQQIQIAKLAPHQDVPSQVEDVTTSPGL